MGEKEVRRLTIGCPWCGTDNWVPQEVTATGYEIKYRCWHCRGTSTQVWNIGRKTGSQEHMEWETAAKKAGVYDVRIVEALTNNKRTLMGDV